MIISHSHQQQLMWGTLVASTFCLMAQSSDNSCNQGGVSQVASVKNIDEPQGKCVLIFTSNGTTTDTENGCDNLSNRQVTKIKVTGISNLEYFDRQGSMLRTCATGVSLDNNESCNKKCSWDLQIGNCSLNDENKHCDSPAGDLSAPVLTITPEDQCGNATLTVEFELESTESVDSNND